MPSSDGKKLGGIGSQMGKSLGSSSGSGPSIAPPSGPSAAELEQQQLASRASSLGSQLSSLRAKASMTDLRSQVGSLDSLLATLPVTLTQVRQSGYMYRAYLEKKVEVLGQQWKGLRQRIDQEAVTQSRLLLPQVDGIQQRLAAMGARLHAATLDALDREVDLLEGRINDALRGVEGTYSTIETNAHQTEQQLEAIQWLQERLGTASFRLRADENAVEAGEAQYLTEGEKDGPKGILFLTDQRLLFEQNEDVATKKFLFITTEKEHIQRLVLDLPIGSLEQAQHDDRGAFKKDVLRLSLKQADVSRAVFHMEGDTESWPPLLLRVLNGEIAGERVGGTAAAPAAAAPVQATPANVPTKCPTCGATLPELLRGQTSLTCEYCNTVVRV